VSTAENIQLSDTHKQLATEKRTLEDEISRVSESQPVARARIARLRRVMDLPDRPRVLDLGCASGVYLTALEQLGCESFGLEPFEGARNNAAMLLEKFSMPSRIVGGVAEQIPFGDESFDIVYASSVIEHVVGIEETFAEIYRVLKPGGAFWFSSASSMCPKQSEIRGFPLFGWYPDRVKRRIMNWAKVHKPELVGYTHTPAINWFTPWKARRMLMSHNFRAVYDRWELRGEDEGAARSAFALRIIRGAGVLKVFADAMVAGCSYAALK